MNLDRGRDQLSLNLEASARPGTAMAENLPHSASNGAGSHGWAQVRPWPHGSACQCRKCSATTSPNSSTRTARREDNAKTDVEKALIGRISELFKANLTAGEIDLGWAVQGPHKSSSGEMLFGAIGGIKVKDGKEVEKLVRDAIAKQPPEKDFKVTFDAARGDDGTPIHQATMPEAGLDPNMVKKMGKSPIYFAFPGNAILVSFGEGGLKAIQQGLEKITKETAGSTSEQAALQSRVSLLGQSSTRIRRVRKVAGEVLQGPAAQRDGLRLSVKSQEQAIRLQLAFDLPAIKLAITIGQLRASPPGVMTSLAPGQSGLLRSTSRSPHHPESLRDGLGVCGQLHGLGAADDSGLVELQKVLLELLHSALAAAEIAAQVGPAVFQDAPGGVLAAAQDLDHCPPLAVLGRGQFLGDDRHHGLGSLRSDQPLLLAGNQANEPLQNLGRVGIEHRREDLMSGLRRAGGPCGPCARIANLSHDNHVRVPGDRLLDAIGRRGHVGADLPLGLPAPSCGDKGPRSDPRW